MKTLFFSCIACAAMFCLTAFISVQKNADAPDAAPPKIITGTAADSAGLAVFVNKFRNLLGDPLNSTPGKEGGRREINWDAVPAAALNNDNFPANFFNSTDPALPGGRKRGAIFKLQGYSTGFRVSNNNFKDVNPNYSSDFRAFSNDKTFAVIGGTQFDVVFQVPGQNVDATVTGFGAVFVDVDAGGGAVLEFFEGDKRVFTQQALPSGGSKKFSFVGLKFDNKRITHVRITSGKGALGAGNNDLSHPPGGSPRRDLVIMDDFLYDEPVAK